jgi:hypothetical protein
MAFILSETIFSFICWFSRFRSLNERKGEDENEDEDENERISENGKLIRSSAHRSPLIRSPLIRSPYPHQHRNNMNHLLLLYGQADEGPWFGTPFAGAWSGHRPDGLAWDCHLDDCVQG